jgi:hypothetical protein
MLNTPPKPNKHVQMKAAEILDELSKLTPAELTRIQERIVELEEAQEVEETPTAGRHR